MKDITFSCLSKVSPTRIILASAAVLLNFIYAGAQNSYVSFMQAKGSFALSVNGKSSSVYYSSADFKGVTYALRNLQADIGRVTDIEPNLIADKTPMEREIVLVGTIGKNQLIDQLIQEKKIDVAQVSGKWETFMIQVVEKPFPHVDRALVIAGSDKRGTIFGIYDLSREIGVSPWYWWADVPTQHQRAIYVTPGSHSRGEPAVRYRGIFINDEEPSLGRWAVKTYGGFNHNFYEKVFELILRLKGNFLWPAMWWASFNSNDPLNPELADEYGIVMGTTHHEPMMRAHAEWKTFGGGDWNYETNSSKLQQFWTTGIQRMGSRESIISLGMRGDGDKAMTQETNIALLERIVADQRRIIHEVTHKEVTEVPQLWALYKEVQDYYDKGMRVPDDVTLLLCDDNWGNVRKLPGFSDKPRAGGYGMYYHFDYVGDPRNYKWLNTNPITKVWEQMHLTYSYGVDRIWIVNVGDIKPLEFPIEFFLDYAWSPMRWNQDNLGEYTRQWVERQFGTEHSTEIADILAKYTKFNGRRKPELLTPTTYSLIHYHEAENVVAEYNKLAQQADLIYGLLPEKLKDAFYQLVLYPVKACANLNELYVTVGKNQLYARQGRASTNDLAEKAKALFQKDAEYSSYYNKKLSGGKWDNMMNQVHIGYTIWQDPKENIMPDTRSVEPGPDAEMGVAIEGSEDTWPSEKKEAVLPVFNSYEHSSRYFEIFNRGSKSFEFTALANIDWLTLSKTKGTIDKEDRVMATIDWTKAPSGTSAAQITVSGPRNKKVVIRVLLNNPSFPKSNQISGFVETDGYVSMEAEHYDRSINNSNVRWQSLPDYGRTLSAMTTFPVTASSQKPGGNSPHLEYPMYLTDTTTVDVQLYLGATLNFSGGDGLRVAVSFDDGEPLIMNVHKNETPNSWAETVRDNMRLVTSRFKISSAGRHVLKYWMVDSGIVLQKIVVDAGGAKPCYLGPPESFYAGIHLNK